MNEYFQPGAVPSPSSPGASSVIRQEFANIAAGFDKLPVMVGHANEIVVVDATGSVLTTVPSDISKIVTDDGVFALTNKTIPYAQNTWPGFGDSVTLNAGVMAGNVLLISADQQLPAMNASLLYGIQNSALGIVDISHGGTGSGTLAGAKAALGIDLKADANNAVLTGAPVCPTPPTGNSSTRVANTQFVTDTMAAIGAFAPSNTLPLVNGNASAGVGVLGSRDDHVHPVDTSRAPASASNASGTSFTPSGNIAATNVQAAIQELDSETQTAIQTLSSEIDASLLSLSTLKAPITSPTFDGDPKAPTPANSSNSTSIATTAFVQSLLVQQPTGMSPSNDLPLMNGSASAGIGVDASRYDHVHPVDTSRAPASASAATGTSFTPSGNIAATTVQAAIQELDSEKGSIAGTNTWASRQTFNAALTEKYSSVAASNIDCAIASVFSRTISGATTLTVSNVAASGNVSSFILELTNGGSAAITWWSGIKWAGGSVPILTSAGTDILGFYTRDGGVTWRASLLARDSK